MAELSKQFRDPAISLGDLDAEAAARVIAATADMALILDPEGRISDFVFDNRELAHEVGATDTWMGRSWTETLTSESQPKAEALISDAANLTPSRWRQVTYLSVGSKNVPILCSAVQAREKGPIVVIGRDLRTVAALQQRLVDTQQSMEQDYARLRHMETRYRLLFQMSSEAVLILDAASDRIIEINPAAAALLGDAGRLSGRPFPQAFDDHGARSVEALLEGVRMTGRANEIRVRLPHREPEQEFTVTVHLFRQEGKLLFLARLKPLEAEPPDDVTSRELTIAEVLEQGPDGFVVTLGDGQIVTANTTFIAMAELTTEDQARGEVLDRWLGKPGVELSVLLATLRQRDTVRLFPTLVYGEYGTTTEVEVSAVAARLRDQFRFGFAIRDIGTRPSIAAPSGYELPHSVDQMAELVGRLSLKEIVRETTDVIERLCIETALQLSHDNRALAAEMLGLSRQSLYVKLRRFGLIGPDSGAESSG